MPSILDQLTQPERELLASLPYRVGMWISQSDEGGGAEAHDREVQALSNILHAYAEDVFGAEDLQYIISNTIMQKDRWPQWDQNIDRVPAECAKAIKIMARHSDEKICRAFRKQLMEIAEAVALAYREELDVSTPARKAAVGIAYGLRVFFALKEGRPAPSWHEFLSISPAERVAMGKIERALAA